MSEPHGLPSGRLLADLLVALCAGVPQRAVEIVEASGESGDADLRGEMLALLRSGDPEWRICEQLGDLLRSRAPLHNDLARECYRAAFYAGPAWEQSWRNPFFARFQANKAGQPFDKWIHYFDIYQRFLSPYVGRPVRVLEIGVFHGGGLDQLRAFLGPEAVLVGMDIDPAAQAACRGKFDVVVGDQTDPDFLARVVAEYGPFDVIIDDGGHTMAQQRISAELLFPGLAAGGIYVVEDCHTSYWPEYQDDDGATFMGWVKDRLDDLHAYHFRTDRNLPVWSTDLSAVQVFDSVVVLEKGLRYPPFAEVAGSGSFLYSDRLTESKLLKYRATANELRAANEALAETHNALASVRESASWKLTSPLRSAKWSLRRRRR